MCDRDKDGLGVHPSLLCPKALMKPGGISAVCLASAEGW